jgi:hypothetical protein
MRRVVVKEAAPLPPDTDDQQAVWNANTQSLRPRVADERTVAGAEADHTKFIVAAPIGVRAASNR